MGGGCSRVKDAIGEKNPLKNKNGKYYEQEPKEHYDQLNTDQDLGGQTTVAHIYKKTREVIGQPAADMMTNPIDWAADYGISFKSRPSLYDFPAFENKDEPANRHASIDVVAEKTASGEKVQSCLSSKPQSKKENNNNSKEKSKQLQQAAAEKSTEVKQQQIKTKSSDDKPGADKPSGDKTPEKAVKGSPDKAHEKSAKKKKGGGGKKPVSTNALLDDCSIKDE